MDSINLSTKLVQYARKILLAERACLIILIEGKPVLKFYEVAGEGKVNTFFTTAYRGPLVTLLETKSPLMINIQRNLKIAVNKIKLPWYNVV